MRHVAGGLTKCARAASSNTATKLMGGPLDEKRVKTVLTVRAPQTRVKTVLTVMVVALLDTRTSPEFMV